MRDALCSHDKGAHRQWVELADAAALRLASGKALPDVLWGELFQIPCEKCKVLLEPGLTIPFPLVYKANSARPPPCRQEVQKRCGHGFVGSKHFSKPPHWYRAEEQLGSASFRWLNDKKPQQIGLYDCILHRAVPDWGRAYTDCKEIASGVCSLSRFSWKSIL